MRGDGDSLWIGVRVNRLQGHDVVDSFLHFVGMDAERRLQQLGIRAVAERGDRCKETLKPVRHICANSAVDLKSFTSFLENLRDDSERKTTALQVTQVMNVVDSSVCI